MTAEKISVLIPASNVEKYIEQSLESLAKQSHRNFEAIVVINNTVDETFRIAKKTIGSDSRFKLIDIGVEPSGIVGALNAGLPLCESEYIARFDADDIMDESRLELQLENLIERNLDLVGINVRYKIENNINPPLLKQPVHHNSIKLMYPFRNPLMHSWLAKKYVYERLSGYRMIPYAEDYDFIGRALLMGFQLGNTKQILQTQVERPGNTASTNYWKQVISQQFVSKKFKSNQLCDDNVPEGLSLLLEKTDPKQKFFIFDWEPLNKLKYFRSKFHTIAYIDAVKAKLITMLCE